MFYKQYGNTGLSVSAIGFGGMRFDDATIAAGQLEACAALVRYAHAKGINYFDTAPSYCMDKSEEIMGMGLRGLPRESFFITSKTNFGQIDRPPTEAGFFRRLEQSLTRLGVSCIDFYHMWCILSLPQYERLRDTMFPWFEKAKVQGMIKHIVMSSHMKGEDIKTAIDEDRFEGMLIGYNALNYRYRQAGLQAAYEKGMGVVVMNPLGGGLIPQNPHLFGYLTEGTDLNVAEAGLRFVAAHREVSVTLCGFHCEREVDEAVLAVERLQEKPAREITAEYGNRGLGLNDLCTGCGYCTGCPVHIPIPQLMDVYNQKCLGKDMENRLKSQWSIRASAAAPCIACGQCEEKCTQHLPIIERLREIAALNEK